MNTGIPLPHPTAATTSCSSRARRVFRRYDAKGALLFERVMQGRELDPVLEQMPKKWPRRTVDGRELPLVVPTVRTAAVDRGRQAVGSFLIPYTYVFDADGEKIRTVQFRAAGVLRRPACSSSEKGDLLVTPGCYEFRRSSLDYEAKLWWPGCSAPRKRGGLC